MAKAREPKVFRSMDDLPLMLTPYDLMDFLGKGQRQTYELSGVFSYPTATTYYSCFRIRCRQGTYK